MCVCVCVSGAMIPCYVLMIIDTKKCVVCVCVVLFLFVFLCVCVCLCSVCVLVGSVFLYFIYLISNTSIHNVGCCVCVCGGAFFLLNMFVFPFWLWLLIRSTPTLFMFGV